MQIKLLIVGYLLSQWTQTQEVKPCQITSHSYGAQAALAQAIRRKHNIVPGRLPSNNSSGLVSISACICFENILKECVAGSFIFLRQACGCRDKDWSLCSKCNYLLRSMSYWSVGAQSANNGMDYWRSVRFGLFAKKFSLGSVFWKILTFCVDIKYQPGLVVAAISEMKRSTAMLTALCV